MTTNSTTLSSDGAARVLGLAPSTLAKLRLSGFGPLYCKLGRRVVYRTLSLSAHRVLSRLEIELAHHGGMDNGTLPCTFDHLEEYGIDRHSIAPAIRECVALGFVEITERGGAGNAEHKHPSLYRLTYRHTNAAEPTHEWKRIKSVDQAMACSKAARLAVAKKTKSRWGKPPPGPVRKLPTGTPDLPMGETPTTARAETPTTSISRGGAGHFAPDGSSSPPAAQRAGERTDGQQIRPRRLRTQDSAVERAQRPNLAPQTEPDDSAIPRESPFRVVAKIGRR